MYWDYWKQRNNKRKFFTVILQAERAKRGLYNAYRRLFPLSTAHFANTAISTRVNRHE